MQKKIKDIREALGNKTYYCALALALTLPDICCKVEKGLLSGENSDRNMYIAWIDKYVRFDDFHFPISGFEEQTFDGKMCYSLRCKVLHNGNTDVKNLTLNVTVDDFKLTLPNDKNYYNGFKYAEESNGKTITYIGIDYLCNRLCDVAEQFYHNWGNKSDFDKFSF